MLKKPFLGDTFNYKFSIGEIVYLKSNTTVKMTILKFSGMRYTCVIVGIDKGLNREMVCFEDDLVSKWQIPFI